ncbi:ATP-dependent zinc protease family protein [Halomonas getboli]|uniref:retropepsin-like aspartic peptidase RloA3 n=1 Tax=Halomonas getboli TaxID=2935862 RepID=UPI001FFE344A|nr:RimK/LysX family protein [Halomonas getboli]MCK2184823.1 RimK/LysX family protein [Halomonas getboli]
MRRTAWCLAAALWSALALAEAPDRTVGWIESVTLMPWNLPFEAKLDSGALTSSLDARDIETFDRDGESWVRFRVQLDDGNKGETFAMTLERPRVREMTVRGAGGTDERPVVMLNVCVDGVRYEEEFSLRDRSEMDYPMLLGRSTIGHLGRLDVASTHLTEPGCGGDAPLVPHRPEEEASGDDDGGEALPQADVESKDDAASE